jgi:hypothetical protein
MPNANARTLLRSTAVSAGVIVAAPFLWGAVPARADTVDHATGTPPMSVESEEWAADVLDDVPAYDEDGHDDGDVGHDDGDVGHDVGDDDGHDGDDDHDGHDGDDGDDGHDDVDDDDGHDDGHDGHDDGGHDGDDDGHQSGDGARKGDGAVGARVVSGVSRGDGGGEVLARTGSPVAALAVGGAVSVLAGVGAMVLGRRRTGTEG